MLHEAGYVHNDIKLDNIMILGSKDLSIMKIVLLDFGLASTYVDKKGNHKPLVEVDKFRGNLMFSNED